MRTTGVGVLRKRFKKAMDSAQPEPSRKRASRPPILAKAMSGPEVATPRQRSAASSRANWSLLTSSGANRGSSPWA